MVTCAALGIGSTYSSFHFDSMSMYALQSSLQYVEQALDFSSFHYPPLLLVVFIFALQLESTLFLLASCLEFILLPTFASPPLLPPFVPIVSSILIILFVPLVLIPSSSAFLSSSTLLSDPLLPFSYATKVVCMNIRSSFILLCSSCSALSKAFIFSFYYIGLLPSYTTVGVVAMSMLIPFL